MPCAAPNGIDISALLLPGSRGSAVRDDVAGEDLGALGPTRVADVDRLRGGFRLSEIKILLPLYITFVAMQLHKA